MSDATTGSAILAGNPATEAAQTSTVAPSAAPDAAPPAVKADPASWVDGITDADLRGYVQNKGWKDPADLAHGYKNLEKLLGGEKLPMPKGADDKDGWSRVYDALGRPKAAEDYKLQVTEGADPAFAKAAAAKFHELGISQAQAAALSEWWNGTASAQAQAAAQQSASQSEADVAALRQEWGSAWDENVELGRRAAREYGLEPADLEQLERGLGTKKMLSLMARIGRGQVEHNFEGGRTSQGFGMTPDAARARISALRDDPSWATQYMNGNADARAEMTRLMQIAYPN